MNKRDRELDAVVMMRSTRDRISVEIVGMSFAEESKWLASQKISDPF